MAPHTGLAGSGTPRGHIGVGVSVSEPRAGALCSGTGRGHPAPAAPLPPPLCSGISLSLPLPCHLVPSAHPSPTESSGTRPCPAGARPSGSQPRRSPSPAPGHGQAAGPFSSPCPAPGGVGVSMEGGMLGGDKSLLWEAHQGGHAVQGRRGSGQGALLGALVWVAFAVRLPFLLRLLVVRVQPLLLFPAHALHHHQHEDDHSQEATHRGAHDDGHRRVTLRGLWGDRAGSAHTAPTPRGNHEAGAGLEAGPGASPAPLGACQERGPLPTDLW